MLNLYHGAFMKVNRDLKGDRIDELKARYGIDLDKILMLLMLYSCVL